MNNEFETFFQKSKTIHDIHLIDHPGLSEIPAPSGSKEVISQMTYYPTKSITAICGCAP